MAEPKNPLLEWPANDTEDSVIVEELNPHPGIEPKSGTSFDDETEWLFRSLEGEHEIYSEDSSYDPYDPPRYERKEVDIMHYFRSYTNGERSYAGRLKDSRTAPRAIELLRQVYAYYRDNVKGGTDHWEMRQEALSESEEILPLEPLSAMVAQSLEALEEEFWQLRQDQQMMRRLKNNVLYIVSEALDTENDENRKKLGSWLEAHWDHVVHLDEGRVLLGPNGEELEDTAPILTQKNIISRIPSNDRARELMRMSMSRQGDDSDNQVSLEKLENDGIPDILGRPSGAPGGHFAKRKQLIAEVLVEGFGVDKQVVKKWQEAKVRYGTGDAQEVQDVYIESYARNFWEMFYLEKKQPGSARRLFKEFGIANFSRYDRDMLLRQLEMADKDVPYGVIMYPEADWNGAFFQNYETLAEASLKLRTGGFETRIVEAGSQRELARRLLRLHKRYSPAGHKFSFAIVGGHGSADSLTLGRNKAVDRVPESDSFSEDDQHQKEWEMWGLIYKQNKGEFSKKDIEEGSGINLALQEWFEPNAPKVLISCSTGVEGGIAEVVSTRSSGETIAPKIPTNVRRIDVSFDETGRPEFSVQYSQGEAGRYVAGKPKE